jgi:RimJ/RimL family protein N-acetyltransferase
MASEDQMLTELPGQLGAEVPGWTPPSRPENRALEGRYALVEPLDADLHAPDLWAQFETADRVWRYMPYGPFASAASYTDWVRQVQRQSDPVFFAIRNLDTGHWEGVASFLRIAPEAGSIEVGHINLSPALQGTRAATEAMFLMMRWAFEAGYRRYEWKCDALNLPSRRAAQRLGLSYEGIFRQATVVKGRNRDTAWFAAIDAEGPALRHAFTEWLAPENFDTHGQQIVSLRTLTAPILVARDPAL